MLTVTVLKETAEGERRVALVPESIKRLVKKGVRVLVQSEAGLQAGILDEEYTAAGAEILSDYGQLLKEGKIFLKVRAVCLQDGMMQVVDPFPKGSVLISFFNPFKHIHNVEALAQRGVTAFSMELVPRISRAQRMDALSAMSSAAGYKAVILAASRLTKFFPLMMTAAGTISPASVLVIGAGVAGLQAVATAKRLGAKVKAFDTRPVVQEQVESLGAEFVPLETTQEAETEGGYAKELTEDFYRHEQATISEQLPTTDAVITTAQIFGKRAPLLITEEMVQLMRRGSVIIDLAAEYGGNCELTIPGKEVEAYGVSIIAPLDLPSTLAYHTSEMYSRNVTALISEMVKEGELNIDFEDEVIGGTLLTHGGKIMNKHVIDLLERAKEMES
jgi:NAD(P) transhydrogenase subunit alpha